MRVLVVTPWFPSELKPGAGVFMRRDAELLQEDHEVTVLHLAASADVAADDEPMRFATDSGMTVIRHPFTPFSPPSLLRARNKIRELLLTVDAVHSMSLHSLMPVRLARPRIPWIHTEHWSGLTQQSLPLKKRVGLILYRSSLSCPDAVVAVGKTLAESARRYTRKEVRVIPNHVPLGTFDRLPDPPEARGDTALKLVAIGNMIHHKGPLQAVEAISELQRLGVQATLTWVGDGPLRQEMLSKASRLGLEDAVFLPGQVDPAYIPELLRSAHVFLLPTASETFGVAIAEALGQGLPVVTTGHGGHIGFVPPGASRVASERTGTAIAEALVSLISSDTRWGSARIIQYAHDQFSEQKRKADYATVYESVV